jgi:hypothetical protein
VGSILVTITVADPLAVVPEGTLASPTVLIGFKPQQLESSPWRLTLPQQSARGHGGAVAAGRRRTGYPARASWRGGGRIMWVMLQSWPQRSAITDRAYRRWRRSCFAC